MGHNELDALWAHSPGPDGRPQLLLDHLQNVAEMAGQFSDKFDAGDTGRWLGYWHDVGKVHPEWQEFIREPITRGPDHSSVGMLEASRVFSPLAFNIAGHHGSLMNIEGLRDRIDRKSRDQRILEALAIARRVVPTLNELAPGTPSRFSGSADDPSLRRQLEFWIRIVHSALVDADSLDTEAHFDPERFQLRRAEYRKIEELWPVLESHQDRLIENSTGHVNEIRAEIYRECIQRSSDPQGIFTLTVPTGGGKTLSSLAFGLRHALEHDLDRVIVVLPYTSIIEQNAAVYRDILGDRAVLEHHSGVHESAQSGEESERERWQRLASENWDVPIVVTTSVQFLESLFSHRNARCRRLHNVVRSVVIMDEIQTLPPSLLAPTLEVLQHLVEDYRISLLLSTATQPALTSRPGFAGLRNVTEIVPAVAPVFAKLERVEYELHLEEPWSWSRVADRMMESPRAMTILNTIRDAMELLEVLDDPDALHLSTQLCGAHRRAVLDEVTRRLKSGDSVRLVATQVVEAGVDLDFPLVLRALGPLDRIVQAAGRCNREGRLDRGRAVVFRPESGRLPPGAYATGTDVTAVLAAEESGLDFHDPELPLRYFRRLYDSRNLDQKSIQSDRERLNFENVGRAYRLIEEDSRSVVVTYQDSMTLLDAISAKARKRGGLSRRDFRRLQPFIVSLREYAFKKAEMRGLCQEVFEEAGLWQWVGTYDPMRGLSFEIPKGEDLVV